MLPLEPIPIFAIKEAGLRLVRGPRGRLSETRAESNSSRSSWTRHRYQKTQLASGCSGGKRRWTSNEQHDGVHRYTVDIHCHGRQRAKGVESDALWVEAQAFEIDARDETSEHPQGGRGVKIAGMSVVALEFVNKVGLGSTHCLEPADNCGADNHRAIGTVAGAPQGHCVVAFDALLILESDCDGVG